MTLPVVETLRRVWERHFDRAKDGLDERVQLRPVQGRGPGDRVESPYDTEARFRAKPARTGPATWSITPKPAMPARHAWWSMPIQPRPTCMRLHAPHRSMMRWRPKASRRPSIWSNSAYVSGDHLIVAREQHGIDLIGPGRQNLSWQNRTEDAFSVTDFVVDWDRHTVRCPEGKESFSGIESLKRPERRASSALVSCADCLNCPSRSRCTRSQCLSKGRSITILPRPEYDALAAARAPDKTTEGRRLYAQRQGIESTISLAVQCLRLTPNPLFRSGQDRPTAYGNGRSHRSRPDRRLVRRPANRTNPNIALRCSCRMTREFATSVRSFMASQTRPYNGGILGSGLRCRSQKLCTCRRRRPERGTSVSPKRLPPVVQKQD